MKRLLLNRKYFSIVSLLFISCATTKIATVRYQIAPTTPYSRVLISVPAFNYQGQQEIESKIKKLVEKNYEATVLEANKLFPPNVEFTPKEKVKVLLKNNIQAMVIVLQESGNSRNIAIDIPTTQQTTGYVGGQYVQLNTPTTTTYSYNLYTTTHAIYIYDTEKGKLVWYASTTTEGYDEASMRSSLINKIMAALIKDNFVQKKKSIRSVPR